jgi:hypothetical protein
MSNEYENLKGISKWKNVVTVLSVEGSRVLKYVTAVKPLRTAIKW